MKFRHPKQEAIWRTACESKDSRIFLIAEDLADRLEYAIASGGSYELDAVRCWRETQQIFHPSTDESEVITDVLGSAWAFMDQFSKFTSRDLSTEIN